MKKIYFNIIPMLMLAATANAQFVITDADKNKTNVDGSLIVEKAAASWTIGGKDISQIAYITRTQHIKMTEQVKANYFQGIKSQSSEGAANYYLILNNDENLETNNEQQYMPTTPGKAIVSLDIYASDSEDANNAILPEGTYTLDESTAAGTADCQTTFVRMMNPYGEMEYKTVKSGTITVTHTEKGYKIDGDFVSNQGETFSVHYEGALTFENKSESSEDSLMKEDVNNTVFKGLTITAHGGDDKYNRYTLQLFDGTDNGGVITDGIVVNVDLFSTTPKGDDIIIADGTYNASPDYEEIEEFQPMTFLSGDCYTVIGYPLYIGTYIQDLRKSAESGSILYGYANKGSITMKRDGEKYNLKLDLTTRNNVHITGEYPLGDVTIIDKRPGSVDEKLKEDKELVFSNDTYSYAYCSPGYSNQNGGTTHDDVNEFELVMNDHINNESFMLDLILPKDKKTPEGTYSVADVAGDKYNEYTFVPGYYVGYTSVRKGTWCYEHYESNEASEPDIIGAATEGTIKITNLGKTDLEVEQGETRDTYLIEYELLDDCEGTKHKVTASWKGKIKIMETGFE